ncbi:MAG: hypothetical protein RSA70_07805, partial [Clostridia bacterium]
MTVNNSGMNETPKPIELSDEAHLYCDIALRATNGVYVVEQKSHKLLYANNAMKEILADVGIHDFIGEKCYSALRNRDCKCDRCIACPYEHEGEEHEEYFDFLQKYYSVASHSIKWQGASACVIYLSDISDEKKANNEIRQIYDNIPGAVFRCKFDKDWT